MDLNLLSKYVDNNGSVNYGTNVESDNTNTNNVEKECLHNAFSDELNELKKNGFDSKIDAYKNTVTGVTTVAIGLSNEEIGQNYVLVKNNWKDNKWDMSIIDNKNGQNNVANYKMENSLWLASHGFAKSSPDQVCIEGLTIEQILKLCE